MLALYKLGLLALYKLGSALQDKELKIVSVDTIPFRAFRLKVLRLTIQVLRLPVFF